MFRKRIPAFIIACAMAAGTLVSCGSVDDSSSEKSAAAKTSSKTSTAGTETTTAEKTTAAETENTSEASTEATTEETTEEETETETAEETTEETSADEAVENGLVGKWKPEFALTETILEFTEDGSVIKSVDYTGYYSVRDGKGNYLGQETEVSFDGKLLSLVEGDGGKVLVTFEKISDEEGIPGSYRFVSDHTGQSYAKDPIETYVISEGKTMNYVEGTYSVNGSELQQVFQTREGGSQIIEGSFSVEGSTLTLFDKDGYEESYTSIE